MRQRLRAAAVAALLAVAVCAGEVAPPGPKPILWWTEELAPHVAIRPSG
jgi:hypothetical protein